ncbi:dihydroneopterin aldolase [Sulfurimonas sp. HSL3-7]|uniref:dihydroneopterin aldolase n=1 Tax=Sulfonitrofixus jiaomeiensis TaxID=3131938 RepID=UPI0031F88CC7
MQIKIKDLEFETIIGILDLERVEEQKVRINCTIEYDYDQEFLNYAEVAAHLQKEMKEKKFELIEEALLSLKNSLKTEFPLIKNLTLEISKPDILPNCEVSLSESFIF